MILLLTTASIQVKSARKISLNYSGFALIQYVFERFSLNS